MRSLKIQKPWKSGQALGRMRKSGANPSPLFAPGICPGQIPRRRNRGVLRPGFKKIEQTHPLPIRPENPRVFIQGGWLLGNLWYCKDGDCAPGNS